MSKLTISKLFELRRAGDKRISEPLWYSKGYYSRVGNAYHLVDCPVCGQEHHLYPWSLAGSGKKCENKKCETAFFGGNRAITLKRE